MKHFYSPAGDPAVGSRRTGAGTAGSVEQRIKRLRENHTSRRDANIGRYILTSTGDVSMLFQGLFLSSLSAMTRRCDVFSRTFYLQLVPTCAAVLGSRAPILAYYSTSRTQRKKCSRASGRLTLPSAADPSDVVFRQTCSQPERGTRLAGREAVGRWRK